MNHTKNKILSENNNKIALLIMVTLKRRFREGVINSNQYKTALLSVKELVPKQNSYGNWQIADYNITPLSQLLIRSRLKSPEVDFFRQNSPWNELPQAVQKEIVKQAQLIIEMTTNCTVGCPFCPISNRGKIQKKFSYSSLIQLIKFFINNQPTQQSQIRRDILYWGTDPFDAKWFIQNNEVDYTDLASAYWEFAKDKNRFLFTSTAVPIGEEFTILKYAADVLTKYKKYTNKNLLRISLNNSNKKRVDCICIILSALFENPFMDSSILISNNRTNNFAIRGDFWKENITSLSTWDITGPNCRDGIIIGPLSIDGVIMEAGSVDSPSGERRFPIKSIKNHTTQYHIPHHQQNPDYYPQPYNIIYPPIKMSVISIRQNILKINQVTIVNNPHRALLKIVGFLQNIVAENNMKIERINRKRKNWFNRSLSKEIALVMKYLSLHNNQTFCIVVCFLIANKFISTNKLSHAVKVLLMKQINKKNKYQFSLSIPLRSSPTPPS